MARMREHLSAYLHVSAYLRDNIITKNTKNTGNNH